LLKGRGSEILNAADLPFVPYARLAGRKEAPATIGVNQSDTAPYQKKVRTTTPTTTVLIDASGTGVKAVNLFDDGADIIFDATHPGTGGSTALPTETAELRGL
jgi:hypothetical protein